MRYVLVPPGLSDQLGRLLEGSPETARSEIGPFTVLTSRHVPPGTVYVLDYKPSTVRRGHFKLRWWHRLARWFFRQWDRLVEESRSPFQD